MRLQKYLADCGLGSRRSCEALIQAGRVQIDGRAARLGESVQGEETVLVDGKRVSPQRGTYVYALYKPAGVLSTCRDDRGRATVMAYFEGAPARLYPVGRLDMDSEGLLLLTNDGALAHRLTHPSFETPKTYFVAVRGCVGDDALQTLRAGVQLCDGRTRPAKVELLKRQPRASKMRITIHEGRNRQVRRMCETVGHSVLQLRRERIGKLTLGALRPGEKRLLTPQEIQALLTPTKRGEDEHAKE